MKAASAVGRSEIDNYARSHLRHFEEAWPGEQRSPCQGQGVGHCRRTVASSSLDKITAEYLEEHSARTPRIAAAPPPPPAPPPAQRTHLLVTAPRHRLSAPLNRNRPAGAAKWKPTGCRGDSPEPRQRNRPPRRRAAAATSAATDPPARRSATKSALFSCRKSPRRDPEKPGGCAKFRPRPTDPARTEFSRRGDIRSVRGRGRPGARRSRAQVRHSRSPRCSPAKPAARAAPKFVCPRLRRGHRHQAADRCSRPRRAAQAEALQGHCRSDGIWGLRQRQPGH